MLKQIQFLKKSHNWRNFLNCPFFEFLWWLSLKKAGLSFLLCRVILIEQLPVVRNLQQPPLTSQWTGAHRVYCKQGNCTNCRGVFCHLGQGADNSEKICVLYGRPLTDFLFVIGPLVLKILQKNTILPSMIEPNCAFYSLAYFKIIKN
jgi:hypothetical protein